MKIIVAGSRSITDEKHLRDAYEQIPDSWDVSTIIHGGADGIDSLANRFFSDKDIPIIVQRPDYSKWPPNVAPLKRNEQMAIDGDALMAVWDGESNGTRHMIKQALDKELPVIVHVVDQSFDVDINSDNL